jgi:hypothetical protein
MLGLGQVMLGLPSFGRAAEASRFKLTRGMCVDAKDLRAKPPAGSAPRNRRWRARRGLFTHRGMDLATIASEVTYVD